MKRATLKDIQQTSTMDTNNMTTEQLRNLVGNAADIANKRIKRLQANEWGKNSIALQKWEAAGAKKFSTKGKNEGQLKAEFKRVKNFLEGKTGSVSGQRQERKRIEKMIGRKFKTPEEERKFWEGYRAYESRAKDKGYFYESNGAISAYGSTTEVDIEKKMEEYMDTELNSYRDPETGRPITYEQAYELAELDVINERAEASLIASPEQQALQNTSFNFTGLGGN